MVLDLLKANGDPFHDIKIYDFEFNSETMSGKKITCSFLWKDNTLVSTKKEYVMYNGEKFTMSKAIPLEQKGMLDDNSELKGMVKYTCEFSSEEIILENIYISDLNYDDVVVQTRNGNRNFYFYDNVSKFASFINANLSNTIPTLGWTCVTQTGLPYDILSKLPEKPIPFNDNTVAEALKSFYDNYKVPFYIENKTIYLGMPSVFLSKTLKFGQGLGLKNNDRIPKNNKVITRIAGRGSDKNLPFRYPIIKDNEGKVVDHPYYRDHLMPTCYVNAVRSLVVDGIPTKIIDYYDADSVQYPNQIDPDMPLLGIKEFDIFPTASYTLIGMVTLVEELDDYIDRQSGELRQSTFKVKLPILPFDLYAQANVDGAMTLSMTSGACKGSQFKVAINDEAFQKNFYVEKSETIEVEGEEVTNTWIEFDPDNPDRDLVMFPKSNEEQIELELFKDIETWGKNYVQPNKWQYLAADSFNFLNIEPPESMITSAQARLDNAMKAYLLDNNTDKYEYPLVIDEYFLQQNEDLLPEIKNNCLVKFDFKGSVISLAIQTITISYGKSPLPKYDIKLTDEIVVNLNSVGQLHDAVEEITTEINSDKLINSRRATDYYSGLKKVTQGVFDADGNNRINDLYARVLYANAAIFGQESSNFAITGGSVVVNNNLKTLTINGGATIQHFWDVITGTRAWYIPSTLTFTVPTDSTDIYYLYVKANRDDSSAWWIVSKDQKKYDSVEGVYYFIAGTFAPMIDGGYRYYSQNGQTSILGGTVALTNIQSPNYEDLGNGGIYGMCIDFLNGRLMAGNGSGGNFITINKDGDGKVRIRGAIVQDSAGNASPILTDRGNWVNTAMYYVGNYFNYNGSSYQCILDTLYAGTLPTNTTYFKPFALKGDPGDPGAAGNFQQSIYFRAATEAEKPNAPTSINEDSYVPVNWYIAQQGITSTLRYEWVCKREKVDGVWGNYSPTALCSYYALNGQNGIIYQNWYKLSATEPSAPSTTQVDNPDLSGSGWYNSKRNLTESEPTEWTSQREKVNGVWSAFSSPPVVSGKFAKDGHPGQDGISIVMQDIVNINCNANGDPRSGTLNQDMYVYAYSGGSLATIEDYELTLISGNANATMTRVSNGIMKINVTGITTDNAKFNVYLSIEGSISIIPINRPLYVNKVKDGYAGAVLVSRGEYQNDVNYYGTQLRTDVVGVTVGATTTWYKAKETAGTIINIKPTVTTGWEAYWEIFSSFAMIATGTLFAENANVAEFIFNAGKMRSQYPLAASMDNKNLILDGVNGRLTALDAVIRGNITAETGQIGSLNILENGLISGNIKISEYPVTPLISLKTASYEYISRVASWTGTAMDGEAYTQTFNVQNKGTIQFKIQMFQVGGGAGWRWELRKTSDNSVVASGQNSSSLSKDSQEAFVYPGGYYLYATPYTAGGYVKLYGENSDDIIASRYYDMRTVLANGGFYCFSDPHHYLYCNPSDVFEVLIGNGGLRVNNSGLFKTTNGGTTWTAL